MQRPQQRLKTLLVLAAVALAAGTIGLATPASAQTNPYPYCAQKYPCIQVGDARVEEGNSGTRQATFAITMSHAAAYRISVNYQTANGTATAGSDYDAKSGVTTFEPGQTRKTVSVAVRGDTRLEQTETFYLDVSSATQYPIRPVILDPRGEGRILNDDHDGGSSCPPNLPRCQEP